MSEQPLDLRESLAVLRRRWVAIAIICLLGFCGGIAYTRLHPTKPSADVLLLLPGQTASGAAPTPADMESQVIIATSNAVLSPVATSVKPPIPVEQLQHLVSGTATSNNVLRIEVRAPSTTRAVQLANAVAREYLVFVKKSGAVDGQTSVLQEATAVVPPSRIERAVTSGLLGLAAGLLLGTIIVLIQARRDRRLWRRDQIAAAIGVPVLASMTAEQHKNVADWIGLIERFDPSATTAWTLRRVLQNLLPADFENQVTIHVISLVGDRAALAAGPQLALFAADSGISTRLAPDQNVALEPLIAACAFVRSSRLAHPLLTFDTENETPYDPTSRTGRWDDDPGPRSTPEVPWWVPFLPPASAAGPKKAQLVVSVLAVEPSNPHLTPIVGPIILSLSPRFAVIDDLARVALASSKARLGIGGIDGILVINPDPSDNTVGLMPDRDTRSRSAHENGQRPAPESPARMTAGSRWPA